MRRSLTGLSLAGSRAASMTMDLGILCRCRCIERSSYVGTSVEQEELAWRIGASRQVALTIVMEARQLGERRRRACTASDRYGDTDPDGIAGANKY